MESALSRPNAEFVAAMLLAANGGYGDAASILLVHCFTGHVTGNSVLAAVGLAANRGHAWEPVFAVCCFLAATAVAQRLRSPTKQALGNARFRLVLLIEVVLLTAGPWLLMARGSVLLIAAMCISLGLQNGALSQAGGIGLHTTYLTGTMTHFIQSLVRPGDSGVAPEERKPLLMVAAGFFTGALCGALIITRAGAKGLWGMPLLLLPVIGISLLFPPRDDLQSD